MKLSSKAQKTLEAIKAKIKNQGRTPRVGNISELLTELGIKHFHMGGITRTTSTGGSTNAFATTQGTTSGNLIRIKNEEGRIIWEMDTTSSWWNNRTGLINETLNELIQIIENN